MLSNIEISVLAQSVSGFFSGIEPDERFVLALLAILMSTVVLITLGCTAFSAANSMHRRRLEADLKQDMLDRGMTADEIAKIIESAAPPENGVDRWIASWCKHKKC